MNAKPRVSFCFTTFKRPEILRETLKLVEQQEFTDFEVIVSDNDPEQSGRAAFDGFDSRFKYFPNNENLGMKKSFNKSVERSSGEYVVMISDDDPPYPHMLKDLIGLAEKYPGYGMYLGTGDWFCKDEELAAFYHLNMGVNSFLAAKPFNAVTVYDKNCFPYQFFCSNVLPNYLWSCAIVKREAILQMGGIPDYGTPFMGDYAFLSIMGSYAGCVVVNKPMGQQTLHSGNFGRAQNEQLVILGPAFIDYVSSKLANLSNWKEIHAAMQHFVAVWLVRHVAFLRDFSIYKKDVKNLEEIKDCERKIFRLPLMKPYRLKYYLLIKAPWLHDAVVKAKKIFKKNQRV